MTTATAPELPAPTAMGAALVKAIKKYEEARDMASLEDSASKASSPEREGSKTRKRMSTATQPTSDETRPQKAPAIPVNSAKLVQGDTTIEFGNASEKEREAILRMVEAQKRARNISSFTTILGQATGALLAILGSIAMTYAIVQSFKAGSKL